MIIDQTTIDVLQDRYQVMDMESRYEPSYAYDARGRAAGILEYGGEIKMRLTHSGFERLIRDLFTPDKQVIDTRDIFAVTPLEIATDKKCVYLAKYSMEKHPIDVVAAYGEKLLGALSAEGCTGILLPNIFDVSVLTVEQLQQMRDNLTELIQSLSYDNIIGF